MIDTGDVGGNLGRRHGQPAIGHRVGRGDTEGQRVDMPLPAHVISRRCRQLQTAPPE